MADRRYISEIQENVSSDIPDIYFKLVTEMETGGFYGNVMCYRNRNGLKGFIDLIMNNLDYEAYMDADRNYDDYDSDEDIVNASAYSKYSYI